MTGKVDWHWGDAKELLFKILKIKCSIASAIYGIDPSLLTHFYIKIFGFKARLAIIQRPISNLR